MTTQRITRRLILIGAGVGLAAAACGDDDETTAGSGGATASSSNTNSSSGNTGGANAGGNGAGGDGSGGKGSGGMGAGMCGAALLAKGSNYFDPHDLIIPLADIEAGVEKQYETTEGNQHTHMVTITAVDFAALQNGDTVKKYVCPPMGNTDHEWVLSCADPNIMPTFEGDFGTPGDCPTDG